MAGPPLHPIAPLKSFEWCQLTFSDELGTCFAYGAAVLTRLRLAVLLVCVFAVPAAAQTLAWDASTSTGVTGYVVSYGTQSGTYTNSVDVGNQTSWALPGLDASLNYFFAVRSYTSTGTFSAYSTEVELPAAVPPGTTKFNSLVASRSYPLLIGQSVTWTASATSSLGPVEYSFWVSSSAAGWVNVQPYSQKSTYSWTPGWNDVGSHSVQVWARTVGSSAKYEAWLAQGPFTVNTQPVQLTASTDFPVPPGQPVTWTAAAAGAGAGVSLEYQFWLYSQSAGTWSALGPYGTSNQATWTPSAVGTYAVQVWVRTVGSTANYQAYAGSPLFSVARTNLVISSLTSDLPLPAQTGTAITWTARSHGGTNGPIQYEFWRYSNGTGWTLVQPYSASNTYTWTPTWGDEGTYALQVWARSANSTASYDAWLGTDYFNITRADVQLSTSTLFPAAPGTTVTWAASVSDPTANVEYEFWVYSSGTGTWAIGQAYSQQQTFTWTPTPGMYALQVWVRKVGSTVSYDAWRGTDLLSVVASPVQMKTLTASVPFPASANTPITWTAQAVGGTAGPIQYEFWVMDANGWSLAQAYSAANTFTWTPAISGTYAIQVWVRSAGSTQKYESWLGSPTFAIQ